MMCIQEVHDQCECNVVLLELIERRRAAAERSVLTSSMDLFWLGLQMDIERAQLSYVVRKVMAK